MKTPRKPAERAADKPVLTPTPAPVPDKPLAPATGAIPADVPTAPAVDGTVPLPSDQMTAVKEPVAMTAVDQRPVDTERTADPSLPPIVPDHPPISALTAPDAEPVVETGVVMERVPGTVPLPADQMTPVAPAAVVQPDADRRDRFDAGADRNEETIERRLFPVAYDVDHDGKSYAPGKYIALTEDEHRGLFRSTAVTAHWGDGLDPALLPR